jgi:hypothetical protein
MFIKLHLFKKKERRKRGIVHMYNTDDEVLQTCRPNNVSEDVFKADIEAIIASGEYHSDEVSETDNEKAREEISNHIRPKNKDEADLHVLRVYDKPWRSRRVSEYDGYFILFIVSILFKVHDFFITIVEENSTASRFSWREHSTYKGPT